MNLLRNLDSLHPEVLQQHGIVPSDYNGGLVFRSAIESIRGTFIASSTSGRQGLVENVIEKLKQQSRIEDYRVTSSGSRCDFEVLVEPGYYGAIEVKGGEGNSIGISDRRLSTREFCIWSHLDGAIKNQPGEGAGKVLGRVANDMVIRRKLVDVVFFRDILCGTPLRPCPKYPGRETTIGLQTAPDVFLLPQSIPTLENPEPPVNTLDTVKLPKLILSSFGIPESEHHLHVWEVHIRMIDLGENKCKRHTQIVHRGQVVSENTSKAWTVS